MVSALKGRKFRPEVYTVSEVSAMLKQCNKRYPTGRRNRAMIATAYAGGLRCAEVLALRVRDVTLSTGEVFISNGKGNKARIVFLNDSAIGYIRDWIEFRKKLGIKKGPLFCTLDGGEISTRYVRQMMERIGRRAQLTKRAHFHGLRHSYAMQNVRNKTPMNVIKRQLGHSSLAVTGQYLDHINGDDLREVRDAIPEF